MGSRKAVKEEISCNKREVNCWKGGEKRYKREGKELEGGERIWKGKEKWGSWGKRSWERRKILLAFWKKQGTKNKKNKVFLFMCV